MSDVLILHNNGANNSTAFLDSSPSAHSFTAYGNAKISTDQSKFGGASGLFDGSGDYITCVSSPDFNFGSGNFTMDTWFRTANAGTQRLLTRCTSGGFVNGDWNIGMSGGKATFGLANYSTSVNMLIGATTVNNSAWHHLAVVRNGNVWTMYMDGVQDASVTSSVAITDITRDLYVGTWPGYSQDYNGYLDEVHINKGTALWTSNFTPPTSEYPTGVMAIADMGSATSIEDLELVLSGGTFLIADLNAASTIDNIRLLTLTPPVEKLLSLHGLVSANITNDQFFQIRGQISVTIKQGFYVPGIVSAKILPDIRTEYLKSIQKPTFEVL